MTSGTRAPSGALGTTLFAGAVIGLVFFTIGYLLIAGGGKLGEVAGLIPAGWATANSAGMMWAAVLLAVPATIFACLRMFRAFAEGKPAA